MLFLPWLHFHIEFIVPRIPNLTPFIFNQLSISRLEKSVEKTEQEINALEGKIAEMDKILENADGSDPEIFKKYDRLKKELEQKMYEWEILQEELEETSKKKNW